MNKMILGYSFTSCLEKPVDIEVIFLLFYYSSTRKWLRGIAKTGQRPVPANFFLASDTTCSALSAL